MLFSKNSKLARIHGMFTLAKNQIFLGSVQFAKAARL